MVDETKFGGGLRAKQAKMVDELGSGSGKAIKDKNVYFVCLAVWLLIDITTLRQMNAAANVQH